MFCVPTCCVICILIENDFNQKLKKDKKSLITFRVPDIMCALEQIWSITAKRANCIRFERTVDKMAFLLFL